MASPTNLRPGTQVKYIPPHAEGNVNHPAVEPGFVTSVRETSDGWRVWCRFWYPDSVKLNNPILRTTRNSEACDPASLTVADSVPQELVDMYLPLYTNGHTRNMCEVSQE